MLEMLAIVSLLTTYNSLPTTHVFSHVEPTYDLLFTSYLLRRFSPMLSLLTTYYLLPTTQVFSHVEPTYY